MDHPKIDPTDLNSPRQELFVCGLEFVVTFLAFWQLIFRVHSCSGGPIQFY